MTRLPTPGSDNNIWGDVLNDFLKVEHNSDGSLRQSGSLASKYSKPSSGIPASDLDSATQSSISASESHRNQTTGVHGIANTADLASKSELTYKGDYNAGTTYKKGEVVIQSGVAYTYINETASSGHTPPNTTYWSGGNGTSGSGTVKEYYFQIAGNLSINQEVLLYISESITLNSIKAAVKTNPAIQDILIRWYKKEPGSAEVEISTGTPAVHAIASDTGTGNKTGMAEALAAGTQLIGRVVQVGIGTTGDGLSGVVIGQ